MNLEISMFNVIGDIGGEFNAFKALGMTMPMEKLFLVGDLNDRGPGSKEVIQFCMDNQEEIKCCHSNHGDMLIDYYEGCEIYDQSDFLRNGGIKTLASYGVPHEFINRPMRMKEFIPKDHIDYLKSLPIGYFFKNGAVVSHAALPKEKLETLKIRARDLLIDQNSYFEIFELDSDKKFDAIWSRAEPEEVSGVFQIFGHNASWGLKKFGDWAICIDTSKKDILTGINYPTKAIFQVPFSVDADKVKFLCG
jgi:hypothetical protein